MPRQFGGAARPIDGYAWGHHKTLLGQGDGGLEQACQWHAAVILHKRHQPSTAPGTVTACTLLVSMRPMPFLAYQSARGGRGRAARGIERERHLRARLGDKRETVAADAGHRTLHHRQHRGRGNRRVDRIAPLAQDLDRRQAGSGMGGGAHRPPPVNRRTPGEVEAAHDARCP